MVLLHWIYVLVIYVSNEALFLGVRAIANTTSPGEMPPTHYSHSDNNDSLGAVYMTSTISQTRNGALLTIPSDMTETDSLENATDSSVYHPQNAVRQTTIPHDYAAISGDSESTGKSRQQTVKLPVNGESSMTSNTSIPRNSTTWPENNTTQNANSVAQSSTTVITEIAPDASRTQALTTEQIHADVSTRTMTSPTSILSGLFRIETTPKPKVVKIIPYYPNSLEIKTYHRSHKHHEIPFKHHLQLVPMEDEPFESDIIKIQKEDMRSIHELIQYFDKPIQTEDPFRNIYIARSCLLWLTMMNEQDVVELLNLFGGGAMKVGKMFATLCKEADVDCHLVTGKLKDINYVPGQTTFEELSPATWNSFRCGNKWHLVFPDFAICCVVGHSRGDEVVLQENDEMTFQETSENVGRRVSKFDDFWFCIRPEIFANTTFPDDPAWQLTKPRPIDQSDFDDCLYRRPGFYMAKLDLLSEDKCVLYSKKGRCTITLGADKALMASLRFGYQLSFVKGTGEISSKHMTDFPRLVMYARGMDTVNFEIRFPVTGHYMFEVFVEYLGLFPLAYCLECRLICTEVNPQWNKPIPIDPGDEGFGFNHVAKNIGLSHPSKKTATVTVQNVNEVPGRGGEVLKFKIDQDRVDQLEFSSEIVEGEEKGASKSRDAIGYARTRVDRATGDLSIETGLTREGECALVVNAREKRPGSVFRRVMNFLVSTHDNGEEEHAKSVEDNKKKLALSRKRQQKEKVKQTIAEHIDTMSIEIEEIRMQLKNLDGDDGDETEGHSQK